MIATTPAKPKDNVVAYCEAVTSGRVVTSKWVRLAVERHLADLQKAGERGFYFDEDIAHRACSFFPKVLRHYKGQWAGQPFHLSDWQQFIIWSLFGWRRKADGLRRFRRAYVTVARKNGKTTLGAGVGILCQYFDEPNEPGAEVYVVATKKEQAAICYEDAVRMVTASPALNSRSKIRKAPHTIWYVAQNSKFQPLGADSQKDGLNPHCVIEDELHAWTERQRESKEKMETGGAARRQPLLLMITTAGSDDSIIWLQEDAAACHAVEAVASGEVYDDELFAYIARIDDEDDPFDESCWEKANPNLGVSAKVEYLRSEAEVASKRPEKYGAFVRYNCNRKAEKEDKPITAIRWRKGNQPVIVGDGAYGHGGIDLGRSNDWCAAAMVFPEYAEDADGRRPVKYQIVTHCWCCDEGKFRPDYEPFRGWANRGLLTVCHGSAVDYGAVKQWVIEAAKRYQIESWAFDPAFAASFGQSLQEEHGLPVFKFTQAPFYYHEPTTRFLDSLDAGIIHHGGDPVLEWQAKNMALYRNHKDHVMPCKGDEKHKVDGMVAMLMAVSECMYAARKPTGSMVVF